MARLGDYELEGLIGRGSTGAVYRAQTQAGGQAVALKRVPWADRREVVERLRAEAAAIAGLGHPHILKVVEVLDDEEGLVIVMQLAHGGSLGEVLRRRVRLPPHDAADIAAKVAAALGAAHGLSIVHSDVKPSNILIDGDGGPALSDFGLSRWTSGLAARGGVFLGTAEYLDPVVAAGAAPGAASDIYSLGIVCYEMLTGKLPYQGATPLAAVRAADRGRPEPLTEVAPDIPVSLAHVVERAMSRRPQARPSTAGELADALSAEIHDSTAPHGAPMRVVRSGHGPAGDIGAVRGPRPLRPRRPLSDRRRPLARPTGHARGLLVVTTATTVLVVLALAAGVVGHSRYARGARGFCRATAAGPEQSGPGIGATTILANIDGDGCGVPVRWSSGVITVSLTVGRPPARFALGQAGDQLLIGEWDCRRATPALYRPSTGQVFYFAGWAQPGHDLGPSVAHSTQILDGVARVVRGSTGGCDRVEVALAEGRPP